MRVLYLTNIPAPYRVDFFQELGEKCELSVLYELERATDRHDGWYGGKKKNYQSIFLRGLRVKPDASLTFEVLKYLRKDYDKIVVGGYSTPTGMLSIIYLWLTRKPFFLNIDGGMIRFNERKINKLIKRFFISKATYWLSTGKESSEYLEYYGARNDGIYKYPFTSVKRNDIASEGDIKNKKKYKDELGITADQVVLSIGQIIHRKGFDVLLEAWKEMPTNVWLYIIGGQPDEGLKNIMEKNSLANIFFIDFKNKEELRKYYLAADIFVLPTREDIWGLVINEAMAAGLPVITTNKCVAGVELIVDGINGYIVEVENSQELAEKLKLLTGNKETRIQMGKNNIEKINEYTIENMAKRHIEIFEQISNS